MISNPLSPPVAALLEQILDLSPEEQHAILARQRSHTPEVCAQVEALLVKACPPFLNGLPALLPWEECLAGDRPPLVPGTALADYVLEEEIGRGGMAVVYRARQRSLDRIVALKMILTGQFATAAEVGRFRTEAAVVARLQHPHIVQIHAIGEHDGLPFLALEYLAGGTLSGALAGRPLPPEQAAQLTATLAQAVYHAHERGILHLDLKPANILLPKSEIRNPKSETGTIPATSGFGFGISDLTPKVTDFGLARKWEEGEPAAAHSGTIRGTPSYMAPEQANADNGPEVGPCSDIYALGAILYELLTGRPPFRAATPLETLELVRTQEPVPPRQLQPKVARDLETVCLKCLEKDPPCRYPSAAELADDLERWLRGEPVRARRVGPLGRVGRWCRRKPAITSLAAALLLVGMGAFAVILLLWRQAAQNATQALANMHQEELARQEAEDNLTMTLQILDDNVRFGETLSLWQADAKPMLVELLLRAEACYTRLLQKRGADEELLASLALVRTRLGHYHLAHGQHAESLAYFKKAARLFEDRTPEATHQPGYLAVGVCTYFYLGNAYEAQGHKERARQALMTSFHWWQGLAQQPPSPGFPANAFLLGLELGISDTVPPVEEVVRRFESLRGQPERLRGVQPYDLFLALQRALISVYRAERLGHRSAQRDAARELVAVLDRYDHALDDGNGRRWLGYHSVHVTLSLRRAGALAEALRFAERAKGALQEQAREAPRSPQLFVKLSELWDQIGRTHWELAQAAETLTSLREAVEAQRRACALAPVVAEHRLTLGTRFLKLGRKYCELGRLDEAEACFRERQALWPGDAAKHTEAVRELQSWAAKVGTPGQDLLPDQQLERQRYLDLCARLAATETSADPTAGKAKR